MGKRRNFAKIGILGKSQNTICFQKAEKRHFRWHYLFWENGIFIIKNHKTLQIRVSAGTGENLKFTFFDEGCLWRGSLKGFYYPQKLCSATSAENTLKTLFYSVFNKTQLWQIKGCELQQIYTKNSGFGFKIQKNVFKRLICLVLVSLFFFWMFGGKGCKNTFSCNFRGFILFCFPGPSPFLQNPSFLFVFVLPFKSSSRFSFLHQPLLREHYCCFCFICLSVVFCFPERLLLYFKPIFPNKPLSNLSCFIFGCLVNMLFCFCLKSCVYVIGFVMLSVCLGVVFVVLVVSLVLLWDYQKKPCFPCNLSVFVYCWLEGFLFWVMFCFWLSCWVVCFLFWIEVGMICVCVICFFLKAQN